MPVHVSDSAAANVTGGMLGGDARNKVAPSSDRAWERHAYWPVPVK